MNVGIAFHNTGHLSLKLGLARTCVLLTGALASVCSMGFCAQWALATKAPPHIVFALASMAADHLSVQLQSIIVGFNGR